MGTQYIITRDVIGTIDQQSVIYGSDPNKQGCKSLTWANIWDLEVRTVTSLMTSSSQKSFYFTYCIDNDFVAKKWI